MTYLHYKISRSEHWGNKWLNYITNTSWNKHRGTIHKIYKWIHSEVRITTKLFCWSCFLLYENTSWNSLESMEKNTSIYLRYNSVWDSLQYRGDTFVGWFHWFRLGLCSWRLKVYCRLCFQSGIWTITWDCKKQQDLSLSSAEVEYPAIFNASQEALWLR